MNSVSSLAQAGTQKTWKTRYTVLLFIWLGWMFSFLDRMIMSVSLPFIGKDLGIDTTEQGLIISAFFLAYAGFQIPGGWLGDKFGPRKVMAFAITWWSIFTTLTGFVFTLPMMLAVRFLFGLGEGAFRVRRGRPSPRISRARNVVARRPSSPRSIPSARPWPPSSLRRSSVRSVGRWCSSSWAFRGF